MSETAVMNVADVTDDFNRVSISEDSQQNMSGSISPTVVPADTKTMSALPSRRLSRNKSGPQGHRVVGTSTSSSSNSSGGVVVVGGGPTRRAPPGRSKSHKIGRPTFDPSTPHSEPTQGINRSKSGRLKAAPGRTSSFNRRVPDRSSSGTTSSLRTRRQFQNQDGVSEFSDDVSVTDSVFTSASIQTLDSIAVRKKQIDHSSPANGGNFRGQRARGDAPAIEFDDTLHTVDSMHLNQKHNSEEFDDDGSVDLSVFSESFASSESCDVLSDFEENEIDGAIEEDEEMTTKSLEDEIMD